MIAFAVRRLLLVPPTVLLVATLVFLLVRVAPGDPAVAILGDFATPDAVQALRERMGLAAPLWVQYGRFLRDVAQGDLGRSLVTGAPVGAQVARALPHTLALTFGGIVIGLLIGLPLGIASALKRNTLLDYLARTVSLAGLSVPGFYVGILLLLLFSVHWGLFPVVGAGDPTDVADILYHLFLPALSLGLLMAAYVTRTTRSSMLNVLEEDFVRTARAKGVPESVVLWRHALRNALIPTVSVISVYAIVLIGSSVMTEIVFSRPGLGKVMVDATQRRDYTTLQSVMVIYAVIVVIVNLFVDLTYGIIDPRVRYD